MPGDEVQRGSSEYQALDGRVVRIQRREQLLKGLLFVELLLAIATPIVGYLLVLPNDVAQLMSRFGNPSMLFMVFFVVLAAAAALGLVAVYMQRTGSLLLAFVLHLVCIAFTITAAACVFVYVELICQIVSLAELNLAGSNVDAVYTKYFCNSSESEDVGPEDETMFSRLSGMRRDRQVFFAFVLAYSLLLAFLALYISYTALQLRFDILKAKYYHRRGWRGLLRMFSRAASIHDNPHRLFNASRELRDTWERAEADKPPALRRQVYSLSNTDAKYRNRALTLTFLLDRSIHRKKVILDLHRRRIVLESLSVIGRKRSIHISRVHSVKLLAEVADGEGSIASLVQLTAERRSWFGHDRIRRWELQFALHLEALRFCQLVQALASRQLFDAAVMFADPAELDGGEGGAGGISSPLRPGGTGHRRSVQGGAAKPPRMSAMPVEPSLLGSLMRRDSRTTDDSGVGSPRGCISASLQQLPTSYTRPPEIGVETSAPPATGGGGDDDDDDELEAAQLKRRSQSAPELHEMQPGLEMQPVLSAHTSQRSSRTDSGSSAAAANAAPARVPTTKWLGGRRPSGSAEAATPPPLEMAALASEPPIQEQHSDLDRLDTVRSGAVTPPREGAPLAPPLAPPPLAAGPAHDAPREGEKPSSGRSDLPTRRERAGAPSSAGGTPERKQMVTLRPPSEVSSADSSPHVRVPLSPRGSLSAPPPPHAGAGASAAVPALACASVVGRSAASPGMLGRSRDRDRSLADGVAISPVNSLAQDEESTLGELPVRGAGTSPPHPGPSPPKPRPRIPPPGRRPGTAERKQPAAPIPPIPPPPDATTASEPGTPGDHGKRPGTPGRRRRPSAPGLTPPHMPAFGKRPGGAGGAPPKQGFPLLRRLRSHHECAGAGAGAGAGAARRLSREMWGDSSGSLGSRSLTRSLTSVFSPSGREQRALQALLQRVEAQEAARDEAWAASHHGGDACPPPPSPQDASHPPAVLPLQRGPSSGTQCSEPRTPSESRSRSGSHASHHVGWADDVESPRHRGTSTSTAESGGACPGSISSRHRNLSEDEQEDVTQDTSDSYRGPSASRWPAGKLDRPPGSALEDRISIRVGTWNMGTAAPDYDNLDAWLRPSGGRADLYAIGVQECASDEWHELLGQHLGSSYVLVAERAMGQIKLSVFVHRRHAHAISAVETSYTPTGVLGIGKNKGGVALALHFRNTRLCFVNCHLAAHQDKVLQRNQDVRNILRNTRLGSTTCELTAQYHTIWMGDLNYRVAHHSRAQAVHLIHEARRLDAAAAAAAEEAARAAEVLAQEYGAGAEAVAASALLSSRHASHESLSPLIALASQDQLRAEMAAGRVFHGFAEAGDIASFAPTYKLIPAPLGASNKRDEPPKASRVSQARGTPGGGGRGVAPADAAWDESGHRVYASEKNRVPAWCDRVLIHELAGSRKLFPSGLHACDTLATSDHKPVAASLELRVPLSIPESEPLYQCVLLLDGLGSAQLDVGDATEKARSHTHAHAASTLKLHAHLPCLHAELGKKCLATCPASWYNRKQLDCGGARLVVGVLLVQPSFLSEQHVLLRLVDWSEGHPTPLGSGCIALEEAVPSTRRLRDYEAPFTCKLALYGRPVGDLTGQLHVVWSIAGAKPAPLAKSTGSGRNVLTGRSPLGTLNDRARGGRQLTRRDLAACSSGDGLGTDIAPESTTARDTSCNTAVEVSLGAGQPSPASVQVEDSKVEDSAEKRRSSFGIMGAAAQLAARRLSPRSTAELDPETSPRV